MITPHSTPAEVIAHHRDAIANYEAALAHETRPGERVAILKRIDGHRERLAKAEAIAALPPLRQMIDGKPTIVFTGFDDPRWF